MNNIKQTVNEIIIVESYYEYSIKLPKNLIIII